MGEQPQDRYPRSWVVAGGPPKAVRWAAAQPVGFAAVMLVVVTALVVGLLWWWLSPAVVLTVGLLVGLAVGIGSLTAQKDLRALLARWDEEHGGR